ncbi:small ribosomal subunit protein uS7m [Monosporozyma servazzii]
MLRLAKIVTIPNMVPITRQSASLRNVVSRTLVASRFQSTTTNPTSTPTAIKTAPSMDPLSDEQIDGWLQTIRQARLDLRKNGPDKTLLSGETIDIDGKEEFTPTEEQVQEYEALKGTPLPLRKDPVLEHVTNMIMRDGKKQVAERIISRALHLVYVQTRKDPVELLKKSLDDMAPLMITKTFNTKVAKSAVIPVPLNQRQRNRIAWKWIVEGANKRVSSEFAVRLGEELVAVSKGVGSGFEKRDQIHKMAITHRSYIKLN